MAKGARSKSGADKPARSSTPASSDYDNGIYNHHTNPQDLDETKAKQFYVDFLGFKVDWEHRAEGPLYMQISSGECLLQLSEHSGDACPGAAVKIFTDAIEEYVEELVAKEYPPGVAEQPWGSLDMLLIDPFANRLIFTNGPIRRS